jgi:hypothetical protein
MERPNHPSLKKALYRIPFYIEACERNKREIHSYQEKLDHICAFLIFIGSLALSFLNLVFAIFGDSSLFYLIFSLTSFIAFLCLLCLFIILLKEM